MFILLAAFMVLFWVSFICLILSKQAQQYADPDNKSGDATFFYIMLSEASRSLRSLFEYAGYTLPTDSYLNNLIF